MKSVEWASLPLDRINSGAATGATVMVETISSPFWVGTYVGVDASIPVGMVLGIDDGIDDTVGTAVNVGASVGTCDTVGALEVVGVAVEGDEEIDGSPDGLLDPKGVGAEETVGFAELVGVTVGTADADGPLETVGMIEIVGEVLGRGLKIGAMVGLPVGCIPGMHEYFVPSGCPSQQFAMEHFSILSIYA